MLTPVSLLGVWAHSTLLDTDTYVDTVAPLASDADVQEAISRLVTQALVANVDVEGEVREALPDRAAFVAPFVAEGFERFVYNATLRLLQSDGFENLWEQLNRRAHARIVTILEGDGLETAQTKQGRVVVQLGPVVARVRDRLESRGIEILDDVNVGREDRQLVLFQSEGVRKVQSAVDILDSLAIVLPILTALLFAAAVAVSPRRRRTIVHAALGLALSVGLVLTLFNVLRSVYLDAIRPENQDAAAAAYDQILGFLRLAARAVFALASVVAVGGWLAGPGRTATRVRRAVLDQVRGQSSVEVTPVNRFVEQHLPALRVLVVGIGALLLVALSRPSGLTVLVIALLVAVGLLLLEFLGRGASRSASEPG